MNKIDALCMETKENWRELNMTMFGLEPAVNKAQLQTMAQNATAYWNDPNSQIYLKDKIVNGGLCKGIENMIPDTWQIDVNPISFTTALSAEFTVENVYGQQYTDRRPIFLLPTPLTYTYLINDSEFCYRVLSELDQQLRYFAMHIVALAPGKKFVLSKKIDGKLQSIFTATKDEDGKITTTLPLGLDTLLKYTSKHLIDFLTGFGYNDGKDFDEAIQSLSESNITQEDVRFFEFFSMKEIITNIIDDTHRFASPTAPRPVPLNLVYLITKKCHGNSDDDNDSSIGVLSSSKIFSVENSRTVICISMNKYSRFQFDNTTAVFDAFKTSTNLFAGRIRMLLDNVKVGNDGSLLIDGKSHFTNPTPKGVNLSAFSFNNFCLNNSDKRLMMSGKLKAQAVNLVESNDHQVLQSIQARTVFADMGAWSYGDNIIISESFAKRLKRTGTYQIKIFAGDNGDFMFSEMKPGDDVDKKILTLAAAPRFHNLTNLKFVNYNSSTDVLTVTAQAPLMIGDKVTNLHSSKGIVGMILPDEKMPKLEKDIIIDGKVVYPAGPFEIILSGISSCERKNVSQIIDAACIPLNIYHSSISELSDAERKEIESFCSQSIVTFNGESCLKPIGIQEIIRLNHDSTTKFVQSKITLNTNKMLKFEEMLILNLGARNANNLLHECKIRNVTTDPSSIYTIYKLQGKYNNNRDLPKCFMNNNSTFNYMKSFGYQFNIELENNEDKPAEYDSFAALSKFFENKVY